MNRKRSRSVRVCLALIVASWVGQARGSEPANPPPDHSAPVQEMEPCIIHETSQLSFGFSVRVVRRAKSQSLLSMSVDRVLEASDADRKGLKAGSVILAINRKPLSAYPATFEPGSELAKLFIGRPDGASILIKYLAPGKKYPDTIKIVKRSVVYAQSVPGFPTDQ
jgi:C-terminal processing protease CtpA/Prc